MVNNKRAYLFKYIIIILKLPMKFKNRNYIFKLIFNNPIFRLIIRPPIIYFY